MSNLRNAKLEEQIKKNLMRLDIMSEWKKCQLGDIVVLNYGKSLTVNQRINGDIPVYSSAGLTGWPYALVNSKGIIVGRKGTIERFTRQKLLFLLLIPYYVLPNDAIYNFDYMFYLLSSLGLERQKEDSAVPGLNRNTAYFQEVFLPPKSTQKKIAHVLSILDDKIELNQKINQTLEDMAQTIFKSWFVDFDPVHAKSKAVNDADYNQIAKELGISREVLDLFPDEFEKSELGMIPKGWSITNLQIYLN